MTASQGLLRFSVRIVGQRTMPEETAILLCLIAGYLAPSELVLAVRTGPGQVYRRALKFFTPDELAEAFAAAHGVAIPTQLRALLKRDPRDLLGEFRALAPPRPPIALQRWGLRRVALAAAVLAATAARRLGQRRRIPAGRSRLGLPTGLRHRSLHDLDRASRAVSGEAAVHHDAAARLGRRRRQRQQRPRAVLAGLRPAGRRSPSP